MTWLVQTRSGVAVCQRSVSGQPITGPSRHGPSNRLTKTGYDEKRSALNDQNRLRSSVTLMWKTSLRFRLYCRCCLRMLWYRLPLQMMTIIEEQSDKSMKTMIKIQDDTLISNEINGSTKRDQTFLTSVLMTVNDVMSDHCKSMSRFPKRDRWERSCCRSKSKTDPIDLR